MKLALRINIAHDESLQSYVSRLARKNNAAMVQDFVSDMGLSWMAIVEGKPEAIKTISEISGISADTLQAYSFEPKVDGHFEYLGNWLGRFSIHRNDVHICPQCLLEDRAGSEFAPFVRSKWLLTSLRICIKHSRPLLRLAQPRKPYHVKDYANVIAQSWPQVNEVATNLEYKAPRHSLEFAKYFENRIFNQPTEKIWLNDLDADIAAKFCEQLGVLKLHGSNVGLKKLSDFDWIEAGGEGFEIASAGLDAVSAFYASLQDRQSPLNLCGFTEEFGFFYRWLSREENPRTRIVREHLHEHICNHYPVPAGSVIAGIPLPERRVHSWISAAQHYGLNWTSAYYLRAAICDDPNYFRCFPVEKYAFEFEMLANGLRRYEAANHLNISIEAFDQLMKAGIVRVATEIKRAGKLFKKSDLDSLISKLERFALEASNQLQKDAVSITQACSMAQIGLVDVIKAILQDDLKPVYLDPNAQGLQRFMIEPARLRQHFDIKSKFIGDDIPIYELRAKLSVSYASASTLVKKGHIPSKQARNPQNGINQNLISKQSLKQFQEKFVSFGELRKHNQLHPTRLNELLSTQGIKP